MSSLGTMPVGVGPVGGVFGADSTAPQIFARVPAPNSTGQSPATVLEFDVVDYGGNYASFVLSVDGVVAYNAGFQNGWTGTVTVITNGVRVVATSPASFTPSAVVTVAVSALDAAGNSNSATWSFTVASAVLTPTLTVLNGRCLLLTTTPGLRVNADLFDGSNYAVLVRLGGAAPMFTKTVSADSQIYGTATRTVIICMRELFSQNGRYALRVSGLEDEFGNSVSFTLPFDT